MVSDRTNFYRSISPASEALPVRGILRAIRGQLPHASVFGFAPATPLSHARTFGVPPLLICRRPCTSELRHRQDSRPLLSAPCGLRCDSERKQSEIRPGAQQPFRRRSTIARCNAAAAHRRRRPNIGSLRHRELRYESASTQHGREEAGPRLSPTVAVEQARAPISSLPLRRPGTAQILCGIHPHWFALLVRVSPPGRSARSSRVASALTFSSSQFSRSVEYT